MNKKLLNIQNWILIKLPIITAGLLVFAIFLILKQQKDISILELKLNDIKKNTKDLESDIDDVTYKLDDVESNLSSEIDDVKRTVRIWSN